MGADVIVLTADITSSNLSRGPVSTRTTPSTPTCTATLASGARDQVEVRPYPQDLELGRVPEGSPLLHGIPRSALDADYAQHNQNCRDARRDTLHVNLLVATDSEDQIWLDKICRQSPTLRQK